MIVKNFINYLQNDPTWRAWQKKKFAFTFGHDDPILSIIGKSTIPNYQFSPKLEKEHDVIMSFLQLKESIGSLRDCEFYFRRFPFRGLPIDKHRHLQHICEMYFSRFYEIRERVKKSLNLMNELNGSKSIQVGQFIKLFDKTFEEEIKERHSIHHHKSFDDIGIDKVFLTSILADKGKKNGMDTEHRNSYRRQVNRWVGRVQNKSTLMDKILDAVAKAMVENCQFSNKQIDLPSSGPNLTDAIDAP